jgi:hypothetical protein
LQVIMQSFPSIGVQKYIYSIENETPEQVSIKSCKKML